MSEQDGTKAPALQRPANDDKEAWKAYWKEQGQPWRTEPEIDTERQKYLAERRAIVPDIERGMYPFKGVRLSRADVEWLLAMEEQRGAELSPRDGKGGNQHKSFGLDLRGVDLSQVNLSDLPLMRLHAGLSLEEGRHATVKQGSGGEPGKSRSEQCAVTRGAIKLGDVGRGCAGGGAPGRG